MVDDHVVAEAAAEVVAAVRTAALRAAIVVAVFAAEDRASATIRDIDIEKRVSRVAHRWGWRGHL
jgi:hypothetical protein